jgi:hypothetical protein
MITSKGRRSLRADVPDDVVVIISNDLSAK